MQNTIILHVFDTAIPPILSKSAKRLESINSIKNGETIRQWLWHIWLKTIHQELSTLETIVETILCNYIQYVCVCTLLWAA
jgi:hypothetical protein